MKPHKERSQCQWQTLPWPQGWHSAQAPGQSCSSWASPPGCLSNVTRVANTTAPTSQNTGLQLLYTAHFTWATPRKKSLLQCHPSQCESFPTYDCTETENLPHFSKNGISTKVWHLQIPVKGNWHHVSVLPLKYRKQWPTNLLLGFHYLPIFNLFVKNFSKFSLSRQRSPKFSS